MLFRISVGNEIKVGFGAHIDEVMLLIVRMLVLLFFRWSCFCALLSIIESVVPSRVMVLRLLPIPPSIVFSDRIAISLVLLYFAWVYPWPFDQLPSISKYAFACLRLLFELRAGYDIAEYEVRGLLFGGKA